MTGGPRVVALLRILAAIVAEHRGWLDDHATFNLVRDGWLAALKEREPPLPAEVESRIAKYRATFDKLADHNLPLEILDQLAWLGEIIATEDRQLPEDPHRDRLERTRGGHACPSADRPGPFGRPCGADAGPPREEPAERWK